MAAALAACERETILPGERLDPRDVIEGAAGAPKSAMNVARPISLPAARANADWPQRAGNAEHSLVHPAIGAGTNLVWSAPIGAGDSRRYRLVAEPVVAGGRVFTIDSHGLVTATSTSGGRLWQADATPPGDRGTDASGAGLAYDGGTLFVTSGFSQLVALDAATGAVRWRQNFDAGIGGAPTVSDGIVYVSVRDGSAWAVRASDGKVLWLINAAPARAGMGGSAAPAVTSRYVIFPFASGEMIATMKRQGMTMWESRVAGGRVGRGYTVINDLTGEPVVAGNTLYAGSSAGRLSAFDLDTGERKWTAEDGAGSPVQVAGGSVFLISDRGQIVRLDAATGAVIWSHDLPYYVRERLKKQSQIYVHYGPVLAGGKLFVASSDGLLRVFDPVSGNLIGQTEIPGGAATDPVVAGGTLYVLSRDGNLLAFR
ncbi:outer membrane protein assembly factor BamB family protein [Paenirhodobacter populi]|uniref:Quinoprotein n=1 Tax=Paenirhodobacter populi TaxID=2306993 RepID=A0A443JJZ6_9RHOB|nr:PQQ-binding-like beta-propeller repeat protein [Sinirhodobacter populi]RWR20878.1 quinoprotein [Sinirhodobacter populi]